MPQKCDVLIPIFIAEKENALALNGTGRNSGVLHAGFYYSLDSLKAIFVDFGIW